MEEIQAVEKEPKYKAIAASFREMQMDSRGVSHSAGATLIDDENPY